MTNEQKVEVIHKARIGGRIPICLNSLTIINMPKVTTVNSEVTCKRCRKMIGVKP